MEKLFIPADIITPEVFFDGDNGLLRIVGKSYPENVNSFYIPLIDYIEKYKQTPASKTVIEFDWLYYNTATLKIIVKMISLLKDDVKNFEVQWHCREEVELMIEKGEELKELLNVKMKLIIQKS